MLLVNLPYINSLFTRFEVSRYSKVSDLLAFIALIIVTVFHEQIDCFVSSLILLSLALPHRASFMISFFHDQEVANNHCFSLLEHLNPLNKPLFDSINKKKYYLLLLT